MPPCQSLVVCTGTHLEAEEERGGEAVTVGEGDLDFGAVPQGSQEERQRERRQTGKRGEQQYQVAGGPLFPTPGMQPCTGGSSYMGPQSADPLAVRLWEAISLP